MELLGTDTQQKETATNVINPIERRNGSSELGIFKSWVPGDRQM